MVIKRSAGLETQALIAELDADDEVRRETAIARLSVIGTRAVDRLIAVVAAPGPAGSAPAERAVIGALRALESIADIRALPPALSLLDASHPEVAVAAVGVTRNFLHTARAAEVLDRLVALVLDAGRPDAARLAALDVLNETGTRVLAPVWKRLGDDPSAAIRQRAAKEAGTVQPEAEVEAAAAGVLPEDGAILRSLVEKTGAAMPLPTLHRLIEVVKAREARERSSAGKAGWVAVRGAIHAALAERESRVALYDLRDTIAAATAPLPHSFALAIASVGDAAALEAIAEAYARGLIAGEPEWLNELREAFRAIAAREKVSKRHASIKRIEARWPDAARELVERRRTGGRSG